MKFSNGASHVEISEAFTGSGACRVYLNNGSSGHIDLDKDHLIKLRNFINLQIGKLQPSVNKKDTARQ